MSSDEDEGRAGLGAGLGFGGRRKRRKQDDDVLGVFAEGEDDSDDEPRKGGKGRGKKGKSKQSFSVASLEKVSFVRGGTINKTEIPAKRPDGDRDGSDEEIDPRFVLNASTPAEPVELGPKRQAKNKMSFMQMAAQYGHGFAMMQKMGFSGGGLGKNEDGIANPIEVNVRKGKQGIQDEGEMVDQDLYGTEHVANRRSVEELLSSKAGKSGEPKASEGWKKGAQAKKPKTVYKTAAEVAAQASEPGAMRIIDMRGPETKIVSSISELQASIGGDTVKSLKELRHNTRLLVAKYEDRIRAIAEKKRHYEEVLISVSKESEQAKTAKSLTPKDIKQCKTMVKKIEDLRRLQDQASINLQELGSAFADLRSEHPKAFQVLRAFDVAMSLAVPVAKRELASWKPLQKPKEGIAGLASWKGLLEAQDVKAVTILCDEVLLPKLRAALIDWNVRDFDACIQLFESCRAALPLDATEALGAHVVLPRLKVEVDNWDPRTDKMPIHIWIHPWLPLLGTKLKTLWTPIRFKLSACLEHWDSRDRSAVSVLRPWQHVFDPADWDPLLEKVLTKLERSIADTPIKPSGQDLQPIEDLLAWLDVIPTVLAARVLDAAFFPQWHAALRQWLRSPGCNFNEVLQWYQGWRTLLPKVLCEQPSVQKQLATGLEVMKSMMSGGGVPNDAEEEDASEPPPMAAPESPRTASSRAAAGSSVAPEDVTLSLSDYMADVAAENGLVFRPKGRKTQFGKEVYQFGAVSVYFDKNLVYAATKGGAEEWIPVSFDEVLKLAKREKR